ncbi:MAG: hypothetical protein KF819_29180 [Labilithrix sp.]|nr:hypothetical protein [Labilithrix sp.]
MKPTTVAALGFAAGAALSSGLWSLSPRSATAGAKDAKSEVAAASNDDALVRANENLTASLHECDRRLAALGEQPVTARAVPSAESEPDDRDAARAHGRRPAMTSADWMRMADAGVVRARIPCLRDKPWVPNPQVAARLQLAPERIETVTAAYAASNRRMTEQITPLCAAVVGDTASAIGPVACIAVIQAHARRSNARAAHEALANVALVQAGKREPAKSDAALAPLERLATVLANESKTFADELADKLGVEEGRRIANAPELCADWHVLHASETRDAPRTRTE